MYLNPSSRPPSFPFDCRDNDMRRCNGDEWRFGEEDFRIAHRSERPKNRQDVIQKRRSDVETL